MKKQEDKTRSTKQKTLILEVLRGLTTHPTADELYLLLRNKMPNISLGTIYRNLENLSKSGKICKLEMAGTQKRFDGRIDEHLHVRCIGCGAVADLADEVLPNIEDRLLKESDYEILGYSLEFSGLCPECKKDKKLN